MRTSNLIQAIIAIAFTFVTLPTYSQTEPWPKRPIKFVVGFGPGGANDIVARIVADGVSSNLVNRSLLRINRAQVQYLVLILLPKALLMDTPFLSVLAELLPTQ